MAKYQILHPSPKLPIASTATILVSFKSLSDAVERFEKFLLNLNLWNFENGRIWPHMLPSFFQHLPPAPCYRLLTNFLLLYSVQVWNLALSFLTSIFRTYLFRFFTFKFFPTFWTYQLSLKLCHFFCDGGSNLSKCTGF